MGSSSVALLKKPPLLNCFEPENELHFILLKTLNNKMLLGSHKNFIKGFLLFGLNENTKREPFKYNHGGIDIEMDDELGRICFFISGQDKL